MATTKKKSGFTIKQHKFIHSYSGDIKVAAKKAGLSYDYARRLVTKSHIAKAIEKKQDELALKCNVQAQDIIRELASIGFSDLTQYLDMDSLTKGKISLTDWSNLSKAQRAVIAEVSEDKDGCIKFKLHSKIAALDKLCRYLGMFERDNEQRTPKTLIVFQDSRGQTILSNQMKDERKPGDSMKPRLVVKT